jgi:uncharacterized heparinase superfamily protein
MPGHRPDVLPAHGHGDILGFEWTVAGRRLVVDTGVFEYAPGERRRKSRSTEAHNTVTVDGADQCEFYGEFRVARRARVTVERADVGGGRIEVTASHDGFTRLPAGASIAASSRARWTRSRWTTRSREAAASRMPGSSCIPTPG